jgi:hypothetical protein
MTRRSVVLPLLGLALASCTLWLEPPPEAVPDAPPPPDGAPAACFDGASTAARALVVTEPQVLARFGFDRVMGQIRASAGVAAAQTDRQLFQAWMKTFGATSAPGDCNDPGLDPNGYGFACPRAQDLKLSTVDPFDPTSAVSFRPVGLFNRFDLTPQDGATCGEYRIVYAMRAFAPVLFGRAFIIFEASMPNPDPAAGVAGCLPIAQFWQSLDDDDGSVQASKLERFYFTGDAVPGLPPVVDARHYGLADGAAAPHTAGQIRTNFFIDFFEWDLREYKLRKTCAVPSDCRLQIAHVPVADNPAPELFAGIHPRSAELRAALLAAVPSLAGAQPSLGLGAQFDELESVSSRHDLEYRLVATPALKTQLRDRLLQLGSPLTADQLLNRATFQTCAGCHELSNAVDLGGPPLTPPSLGFVHIDETGQVSPALFAKWLPEREQTLIGFIEAHCGGAGRARAAQPADGRFTIGGSRVGAAH